MTKPSNFNTHSGYKSIGNDDKKTITLNIPASFTMPIVTVAGVSYAERVFSSDLVLGTRNAPIIVNMTNSRRPGTVVAAPGIVVAADNANMPGFGNVGPVHSVATIERINPTTIRLTCSFALGSTAAVSVSGAAQTVIANIATFTDPFLQ